MPISPALLRRIGGARARPAIVEAMAAALNAHAAAYGVTTPLRLAHFLAQAAHESAGFATMEEYASGAAYEGRRDLGNVTAGDGRRYKGRGCFQLTGRQNYRRYGQTLGLDLEGAPQLAADPAVGVRIALLYWHDHGLNALADRDDLAAITRRINGGLNGYDDRRARLEVAKRCLSDAGAELPAQPAPTPAAPAAPTPIPMSPAPARPGPAAAPANPARRKTFIELIALLFRRWQP